MRGRSTRTERTCSSATTMTAAATAVTTDTTPPSTTARGGAAIAAGIASSGEGRPHLHLLPPARLLPRHRQGDPRADAQARRAVADVRGRNGLRRPDGVRLG